MTTTRIRKQRMRRAKVSERHAAARMVERYGASVSFHELRQAIKKGRSIYLSRQSTTRSVAAVIIEGKVVPFIINRIAKRVITVLTREQAEERLLNLPAAKINLKELYDSVKDR